MYFFNKMNIFYLEVLKKIFIKIVSWGFDLYFKYEVLKKCYILIFLKIINSWIIFLFLIMFFNIRIKRLFIYI